MEAQFLQAQNDRLDALKQRENARRSKESAALAAAADAVLEKRWSEWRQQFDALEVTMEKPPALENEKRRTRLLVDELQNILNLQRREVSLNESLSDVTITRWHKTLVAGQGQLDKLKEILLPNGKFVFRRYRQAMENRQANETANNNDDKNQASEFLESTKLTTSGAENLINCLEDFENKTIEITDHVIKWTDNVTNQSSNLKFSEGNLPLVWRRLKNCSVQWHTSQNESTPNSTTIGGAVLHLVNLGGCQLHIASHLSSVHVTDCTNIVLRLRQVQQVRLHTSSDIKVWGRITGGAILEACQNVGVTENCPNVQDFSWLKAGRPSPNLERLREAQSKEVTTKETAESKDSSTIKPTVFQTNPASIPPQNESAVESDDEI